MTPKISVVITTYNRKDKLKKAVKSVLNQSFQEFEIIVVDDVSIDGTDDYMRKMAKKHDNIRYIKREKNWGDHSRPKNDGIKAANADLIAYLDDDNIYLKDHLQALYKAITEDKDVQMVYGDRWIIADDNSQPKTQGISFDWHPGILQSRNYIDTSDVLMKKEVLYELGGWDESLKKFADWNLWVRFAKVGYVAKRVPLILTEYHIHEDMAQIRHKSDIGPDGRPLPTFQPDACKIFAEKTSLGKPKIPTVCALTINWNRLEYLKTTIDTMHKTAEHEFDHYIVDNGSDDGSREYIEELIKKGIIKDALLFSENKGCPHAYNEGVKMIKNHKEYDLIVLTDNDVKFKSDGWLADAVDLYERQQKLILSPYVEGLRDNPGGSPRVGFQEAGIPPRGYVGKHWLGFVKHMGNICQIIPMRLFKKFKFKEDTFKHGTQSFQMAGGALQAGYMLAYMENVYVEHIDTTAGQEKKYPKYFDKLKKAKQEKYG